MTYVLPLPLPKALVDEQHLVPRNDFAHEHITLRWDGDGRGFVHSEIFCNFRRYDRADDRDFHALIVTVVSPTFSIERQHVLADVMHDLTHTPKGDFIFNNSVTPMAVSRFGEIAFSTSTDHTVIFDSAFEHRRADLPDGASDITALPDGSYVIARHREVLAHAGPETLHNALAAVQPFGSIAAVKEAVGYHEYRSYIGPVTALAADRVCIAMFAARSRGGYLSEDAFRFAIVDGKGSVVRTLSLGAADTPYGKTTVHDTVVAHPVLDAWITRSDAAMHVFDRDGQRISRIALTGVEAKSPLAGFTLFAAAPTGELVLVHRKHSTLLITDPVRSVRELADAVSSAAAMYAGEYARLKKAVAWQGGRFLGFEAVTSPATVGTTKTKKLKQPKATPVSPAPLPVATTPGEAIALDPENLEAIAIYGDSLAGDPLGELINVSVRLALAADPALERRKRELWGAHGRAWLARWNTPNQLFEDNAPRVGLPSEVTFNNKLPTDLAALDRQLANFPIATVTLRHLTARDITRSSALPLMRRIVTLIVTTSSKRKLGHSFTSWLAEQGFANLGTLQMSSIEFADHDLRALVVSMPRLHALHLGYSNVTSEAIRSLADTAGPSAIAKLYLRNNPLGSTVLAAFAGWTALRDLDLGACDLGDDVVETPLPELAVERLTLGDNPRLGSRGLAALIARLPALVALHLTGRTIDAAMIETLIPIADRLQELDTFLTPPEARSAVIRDLLPRAPNLRKLDLSGLEPAGHTVELLRHAAQFEALALDVTPADVELLAKAPFDHLKTLSLTMAPEVVKDVAGRLFASPHLNHVTLRINHHVVSER